MRRTRAHAAKLPPGFLRHATGRSLVTRTATEGQYFTTLAGHSPATHRRSRAGRLRWRWPTTTVGYSQVYRHSCLDARRAAVPVLGVILAVVTLAAAQSASASSAVPSTAPCPDGNTSTFRGWNCVGNVRLQTRGFYPPATNGPVFQPATEGQATDGSSPVNLCLTMRPVPGQVYPSANICGGPGGGGAAAIEQARLTADLGELTPHGVDANVQWDVRLENGGLPAAGGDRGWGRADLTYTDPSTAGTANATVQVYAVQLTSASAYSNVQAQVTAYVDSLNSVYNVQPAAVPGQALQSWHDVFVIPTGQSCEIAGQGSFPQFMVYVGWQTAPGVIGVASYVASCFDPTTDGIPDPVGSPAPIPAVLPAWVPVAKAGPLHRHHRPIVAPPFPRPTNHTAWGRRRVRTIASADHPAASGTLPTLWHELHSRSVPSVRLGRLRRPRFRHACRSL